MAYFSYVEYLSTPTSYIASNFMVPTWAKPVIPLCISAIIFPGPSIVSHILGLAAGYLMALGYLKYMIEPSSKAVLFIESKIAAAIDLIPDQIKYIREVDAIEIRKSVLSGPTTSTDLPLHEVEPNATTTQP